MDDSDSCLTRKRPRLYSGDRSHRSMSQDELSTTPQHLKSNHPPSTPASNPTGEANQVNTALNDMVSTPFQTPSKVTINVRESGQGAPQQPPSPTNQASDNLQLNPETSAVNPAESPTVRDASSPDVISVSSSPPRSPEIEVAEIEDMEDHPHETKWRTVRDATDVQMALLAQFPYYSRGRHLWKTVEVILEALEEGTLQPSDRVFKRLSHWIEGFLESTESLSSQWREMFLDQKDFWAILPQIAQLLWKRCNHTKRGEPPFHALMYEDDSECRQDLPQFFSAFTALIARIVKLDCQVLETNSSVTGIVRDLVSDEYIRCLGIFTHYGGSALWGLLQNSYGYDSRRIVTAIIVRFLEAPSYGIENMSLLLERLMNRSTDAPGLLPKIWPILIAVNRILTFYRLMQDIDGFDSAALPEALRSIPAKAYRLYELVDSTLQTFISKQTPALSQPMAENMVTQLSLMRCMIATADEKLAATMLQTLPNVSPQLKAEFGPTILELTWKFQTFRKFFQEGRMEIRVQGVELMQQELVSNLYSRVMNRDAAKWDHPLAQYIADLILDNRLVQYLVGVESHAQLISRCGNIFGFLAVTHRYTNAETDAIWKAVRTSQDSRVVDAILTMLGHVVIVAHYQMLLYLTTKLNELPLHNFDNTMIQYVGNLLHHIRLKWKLEHPGSERKMDMPPYHLCIRLIRESAANQSLAPHKQREIKLFATHQLQCLLALGPSDADRKSIYEECVKDISGATQFATGSLSAIQALLGDQYKEGIVSLASTYDISSLLIMEYSSLVETGDLRELTFEALCEHLGPRFHFFALIIAHAPESIDLEHGNKLWSLLLGSQSLNGGARDRAWIMLAEAIKQCPFRNTFIDRCLNIYLPTLPPSSFATRHSLSFLEQVILYESRTNDVNPGEHKPAAALKGVELLWHLSIVAPPKTIELEAITKLVSYYLNLPNGQRSPRTMTESIYIEVVERCIRQLTAAASKLKAHCDGGSSGEHELMAIVLSEEEWTAQRLSFTRSLLIMKEFVKGARSRPTFSPLRQTVTWIPRNEHDVKGKPMNLPYQTFNGSTSSGILRIDIGDEETLGDLAQRLRDLSGFAEFTLIAGGRRLDLEVDKNRTLEELKIDQNSFLLVKKMLLADSATEVALVSDLKPLEGEIMKHFPSLYDLLAIEDSLAKEMYDFLLNFPPHRNTTALVCGNKTPIEVAFPPKAPYQSLYSTYALKSCLAFQLRNGTASQEFISHGVRLLATVLTTFDVFSEHPTNEGDIVTAAGLVDCLLAYLREPTSAELSMNYVLDPPCFVQRLESCILSALACTDSAYSGELACNCFAVLLEASLHCGNVWHALKATGQCAALLQRLILEDPREHIRKRVADCLRGVCAALPNLETTTAEELESYFWNQIRIIIPRSLEFADNCQQFFEIAVAIFKSLDHMNRDSLELEKMVKDWSNLLLVHKHREYIGSSNTVDWVASGISSLLQCCVHVAKSFKKPMRISSELTSKLFNICLFPDIPYEADHTATSTLTPILHSQTRNDLYQVILALSNDNESYQNLLGLVDGLLPQGEDSHAWSWGIAQISEESLYEANWNLERNKLVLSPTGYPGLRNLSNTCYLNSLFTQLFMNVGFREFILKTNITEGLRSQRLLAETKQLFAYMQNTVLKAVDPQGIAESVITYDGTQIDVSVQMDVDEFFNLLFDRWESQILSDADKKSFRNFYGGQIVQQIKSKECSHISERLEPFSAIQCDIQGKATLKDSLDAYVSGEIMEGDNKYSCTSCGRYVDAIKRACLRDVPDNLIFHLKRFDYDLMTGLRSKINDRFEFPSEIDMAPYNVAYLKDSDVSFPPDVFELVGVLVHSGTAESGHYYSYIRERPANPESSNAWVEYNDADITRFDPVHIPDQCYGGLAEQSPFTTYPKQWNAYMLFYQRKKAIISDLSTYRPPSSGSPVKIELPEGLVNQIALDNALFIRKYCILDQSYADFASNLLEQLSHVRKGVCSEEHLVEKESIWLALKTLNQVFSRARDFYGFDKTLGSLTKVIGSCTACCKLALDWVVSEDSSMRNMLLRCPSPKIRRDFGSMILIALRYLRENDSPAYGLVIDSGNDGAGDDRLSETAGAFQDVVYSLRELRKQLPVHGRAWDDYFGLIAELAAFGNLEAYILVREGFLRHTLDFLTVEHQDMRTQNSNYLRHYVRLIEKGRKFSLHKLIELVRILLEHVDLAEASLELRDNEDRPVTNGKARLNEVEESLLRFGSRSQRPRTLIFLEKILGSDQNRTAANSIVRMMLLAEPDPALLSAMNRTIVAGVNVEPATMAAPYLSAAIVFCESCAANSLIKDLIRGIAQEVDTIGLNGGQEHLEFFACARRLSNTQAPRSQSSFHRLVLLTVPQWAPALLMYWEESVRLGTIELLKTLVFDCDTRNMDNEREASEIESIGRDLCEACLRRTEENIIEPRKQIESKHLENVIQVIKHCVRAYCDADDNHRQISVRAEVAINQLQALTVSEAYDAVSDTWNDDNSTNPTDSESDNLYLSGGL